MLLETRLCRVALTAFLATLKKEPNRLGAYVGAASGRGKVRRLRLSPREYYGEVVTIAGGADKTRTEVADAQAFLQKR